MLASRHPNPFLKIDEALLHDTVNNLKDELEELSWCKAYTAILELLPLLAIDTLKYIRKTPWRYPVYPYWFKDCPYIITSA